MPDGYTSAAAAPRTPPHNAAAEQALLGAILVNNRALERVADFLRADHFFDPTNARLYAACEQLIMGGGRADSATVQPFILADPDALEYGGARYPADLAGAPGDPSAAADYGRAILDAWRKRSLIEIGEEMCSAAFAGPHAGDAESLAQLHGARIFETIQGTEAGRGMVDFGASLTAAMATADRAHRNGAPLGLRTGLIDLDRKTGGLHPTDLIILAGRPSMGKTALATNIAFNIARGALDEAMTGAEPVGFWSLEMGHEQLTTRIVCGWAGIDSQKVRLGELENWEMQSFVEAANALQRRPLHIDDTPALTIDQLRLRVRAAKRSRGIRLAVVDYLQLLRGAYNPRGSENRTQEVSEITRGLKAIAKEEGIPVLALSQLSRQVEQREDKRPNLADLRESGSIEQDADVVMFVFREQYYLERAEPGRRPDESDEKFHDRQQRWQAQCEAVHGTAEVIIAKQRNGPVGAVRLAFDAKLTRFSNLDSRQSE